MKKVLFILLILTNSATYAGKDVVTHVLDSENKFQLYGSSNPSMEQLQYVWSISDQLIDLLLDDPKNDRAWAALHKYRSFTGAGVTQMFNDACFRALKKNPMIFLDRYMAGDDKAVNRAMDAAWGFSEVNSQSSNTEDMAFLYRNIDQIKRKAGKGKRQNIFIEQFSAAINDRKRELS